MGDVSSKQIHQSQLKIATLRKFDKAMRFNGFNKTKSQKSTYSFFEEIADINVLDEASDEEDLNSSCGQSRADDALITVDELILSREYDDPMVQDDNSLVDGNDDYPNDDYRYENGFEATFELKQANSNHYRDPDLFCYREQFSGEYYSPGRQSETDMYRDMDQSPRNEGSDR